MLQFPTQLQKIPSRYLQKNNDKPGKLVSFNYDTYESFSYQQKSQKLTKRAIVYLPYNYSSANEYNVFYLMHGGWSDETTYLGTPDDPHPLKNIWIMRLQKERLLP